MMSNKLLGLFCFKDKGLMNAERNNQMTEPIFRAFSIKIKPTPPLGQLKHLLFTKGQNVSLVDRRGRWAVLAQNHMMIQTSFCIVFDNKFYYINTNEIPRGLVSFCAKT